MPLSKIKTNSVNMTDLNLSGSLGVGTNTPNAYNSSKFAVANTSSSGAVNAAVINGSTATYEGAGVLLGNVNASANVGATYLYHTKFDNGGSTNTTSYSFNISQRKTDGTYISNIWNVDYQNNVHAWYRPNNSSKVMEIDANSNLKFNSGFGSVATAYGVRAWVNFNGTGTPSIRGSGNVSSITDNNVGQFYVNFSSAMPDSNYACFAMTESNEVYGGEAQVAFPQDANRCNLETFYNNTTPKDNFMTQVMVVR